MNSIKQDIILFDGDCNFCTGWVLWVIKHDRKNRYRFSASQLHVAQNLLNGFNNKSDDESVVLISGNNIYQKSDAALRIVSGLGGIFKLAYLLFIFPKFVRNFVYDFIAKRRYKWFGKREQCYVPDENTKSRFL